MDTESHISSSDLENLMEEFFREFPYGDSLELARFMYERGFAKGAASAAPSPVRPSKPAKPHPYLCHFSIYKYGDMNRRPHVRTVYIKARNAKEAYRKALTVCNSTQFSSLSDSVVCRHRDIQRVKAAEALDWIKNGFATFLEVHLVVRTKPDGTNEQVDSLVGTVETAKVRLAGLAADLAASGLAGDYPHETDKFQAEVGNGLEGDGLAWKAKDGTVLKVV